MADNPFLNFLNQEPEAGYFSYQNQWKSPNQKKFFQSQFSNIQNQYMGQLGATIRGGGEPTQNWTDFLGQYDWGQQFQSQTPQQRGIDTSRYNPFTKWLT